MIDIGFWELSEFRVVENGISLLRAASTAVRHHAYNLLLVPGYYGSRQPTMEIEYVLDVKLCIWFTMYHVIFDIAAGDWW